VATVAGGVAHGVLHGEPIAVDRHRLGTVVKAATLHGVRVTEAPDRVEIALVVDV
jgi:SHS2 domain-containing protein